MTDFEGFLDRLSEKKKEENLTMQNPNSQKDKYLKLTSILT